MERVLNPLGSSRPENTLLIAAMKLVATSHPESSSGSSAYQLIRSNILRAVTSGLLDLKVFQALLLLALHELGHGVYPEAYMTVGSCIRYGTALKLDKTIEHQQHAIRNTIESEESKRGWWAALILDR